MSRVRLFVRIGVNLAGLVLSGLVLASFSEHVSYLDPGAALLLGIAFLLGLLAAVLPAAPPKLYWTDVGYLLAGATLLLLLVVHVPPIRRPLTILDHHRVFGGNRQRGGLGLAVPDDLFDPELAPVLLRDPIAIEFQARELDPADTDLVADRADWSVVFAALRLQGKSTDDIWNGPNGRPLFLGMLAAECVSPKWKRDLPWLATGARTGDDLKVGLLDPADVSRRLQSLDISRLSIEESRALVFALGHRPDLFPPDVGDRVLADWKDRHPEEIRSLGDILAIRQRLKALLPEIARHGTVAATVTFPPKLPDDLRVTLNQTLSRFVGACGYRLVPGNDVRFDIALEKRPFDDVTFSSYTYTEKTIRETQTARSGGHRGSSYSTKTVERTEYVKNETTGRGSVDMPSMVLTVTLGDRRERFVAAPFGSVILNRTALFSDYFGEQPIETTNRIFFEFFITDTVLRPWRFGLDFLRTNPDRPLVEE